MRRMPKLCTIIPALVILACTLVAAKHVTDDGNVDPSTLPPPTVQSVGDTPPPDGVQSLSDTIANLAQAVCKLESGYPCTSVDVLDSQIVSNQTVSIFWCPARSFEYTCRMDKQYFEQTTHTSTTSHAWSVGQTFKVYATYGVQFMGMSGGVGPFLQYTFSYAWNEAHAEAHTEQDTTVQSTTVDIPANSTKCLQLRTVLSAVDANGTEPAWGTASGWIGTYQKTKRHWKWDGGNSEYYYRAFTVGEAVRVAQEAGLPEAKDFAYWNDNAANITSTINLRFNVGTSGRVDNMWYDKDSTDCTSWDPAPQRQVGKATLQNGEEVPVLDAIRLF